jgi:DNA (cytosine-5)-methyltransferase 1
LTAGRNLDILSLVSKKRHPSELLLSAVENRGIKAVATDLRVSERSVRRWLVGEMDMKPAYELLLSGAVAPRMQVNPDTFTFIDLFAGIGGLRKGFERLNGKCVFTSEWDKSAQLTYQANFGAEELHGDITRIAPDEVPNHDILLAGFPCQPFSLAGVTKKRSLGREHGFKDETQGTLFFNVVQILDKKKPKGFLLENVKNLRGHDGGNTYKVIYGALKELGYQVEERIIDSSHWVPQKRERIFLVGFRKKVQFSFDEMAVPRVGPRLRSILHSSDEEPEPHYTKRVRGSTVVDDRYTLSDHLWQYLQDYAAKHRSLGNGFGCSVFDGDGVARTLSARYHKDGSEILIAQKGKNPRRLTPRECARLMGFDRAGSPPLIFPENLSDTQAYRQLGNSVVVPVVEELAKLMVPRVMHPDRFPPKLPSQYDLLSADH